ncbi:MAG: hypothetical protein ACOCW2_02045 [Chitinivibrionales bacterium]
MTKARKASVFHSLSLLLSSSWDIRIGVSGFDTSQERHVVVAVHRRKGTVRLVGCGGRLQQSLLTLLYPSVHADCGNVPVVYISEKLHGEDPETWIDREEKRLIPWGMASDQITTEWDAQDDRICAASIRTDTLQTLVEKSRARGIMFSSLAIPLMDTARLYAQFRKDTFLLWDIAAAGSTVGYVEDGRLKQVAMHWVGQADIRNDPQQALSATVSLMQPLSENRASECIVLRDHELIAETAKKHESMPAITFTKPPRVSLSPPPGDLGGASKKGGASLKPAASDREGGAFKKAAVSGVKGAELKKRGVSKKVSTSPKKTPATLDEQYHQAYALALHEQTHADFAPFEHMRDSMRLERSRRTMMGVARWAVAATIIIAVGLGAAAGGIGIARTITEKKIAPARAEITRLNRVEASHDSLRQIFDQSAQFLGRESVVTELLSGFQHAFPEGAWAEDITVAEKDTRSWDVSIIAVSYSTATIPVLIGKLEKIAGIRDVKMQYSEQTKVGSKWRKKSAVRLKLVCSWGESI